MPKVPYNTNETSAPQITITRPIPGVEAVCIKCGQTRKAYVDGQVDIIEMGQGEIDEDKLNI